MNRPVQNLDQQNFHTSKIFRFIFNKLSPHSNFDGSKSELTGSNTELCFCRGWKIPQLSPATRQRFSNKSPTAKTQRIFKAFNFSWRPCGGKANRKLTEINFQAENSHRKVAEHFLEPHRKIAKVFQPWFNFFASLR